MRYPKTMSYPEFNTKLCKYKDALRRAYKYKSAHILNPKEKWAKDALDFEKEVEESMADKDHNFRRWIRLEACGFTHPATGNDITVEIGDDHEAIYNFLLYCKRINRGIPLDDDFASYLAYLISRSVHGEEGC